MKKILLILVLCVTLALTSVTADGGKYQITMGPANEEDPSMIALGDKFYVAYVSQSDIFVVEYDKNFSLIGKYNISDEALLYSHPSLTYADNNFYITYASKENESGSFNIFVKKYDKDFDFIESYQVTDQPGDQSHPSTAYFNNTFYVVYESDSRGGDVFARKYDENFTYISRYPISDKPSFQGHPSIAYIGDSFYVAYASNERGNYDIFVMKFDKNFDFHNEKYQITDNEFSQQYPSTTYANDTIYIAYASNETGNYDIFVKKYWKNLEPLNFVLARQITNLTSRETRPSALFSDNLYVVYQSDETDDENLFVWALEEEVEEELDEEPEVIEEGALNMTVEEPTHKPPSWLDSRLIIAASLIGALIVIIIAMFLFKREEIL